MFDIGWMEILVISVVAVVVIGPQELPKVLANVGRWVTKGRAVAREFQDGVQSVIREAELEELRVDMPDANKIFGENPITQGKSIVGGDEPVPEDQFIDDKIIAEMEEADARTVESLRLAEEEGAKARADTGASEKSDEETTDNDGNIAPDSAEKPDEAVKPPVDAKSAAES